MNLDTGQRATSREAISLRARVRVLLLWSMSITSAAIGTWLLYDELPGTNWTLWALTTLGGFVYWARCQARPLGTERATLLALALALAAGAGTTGMPLLHVAIGLGILMLAALAILASDTPLEHESRANLVLAPLAATAVVVKESALRSSEAAVLLRAESNLPTLRGSIIAAPIVTAFFILLSAADPTLAAWRTAAWQAMSTLTFVPPTLLFLVLSVITLGAYGIAARQSTALDGLETYDEEQRTAGLGDTERLIVLGSVAVLFAVFLLLQLSYLFDNSGSRAGSGMTYADAAHRGFIELTLTATLTAILILVLDRWALAGTRERWARYCALLLIAESLPMLLSANSRIAHYEAAYGYTLLRLYVHVYIAVVCVAMVLLAREALASIDLARLTRRVSIAATLAIVMLAFWNHPAWVVDRNVDRYVAARQLDLSHLTRLAVTGPDAIPALVTSLPRLESADAAFLRGFLAEHCMDFADEREPHWYRWNLRRAQAKQALLEMAARSTEL